MLTISLKSAGGPPRVGEQSTPQTGQQSCNRQKTENLNERKGPLQPGPVQVERAVPSEQTSFEERAPVEGPRRTLDAWAERARRKP